MHRVKAPRFAVSALKNGILAFKKQYLILEGKILELGEGLLRVVAEVGLAAVYNYCHLVDGVFACLAQCDVLPNELTRHIIRAYKAHILKNAQHTGFSGT